MGSLCFTITEHSQVALSAKPNSPSAWRLSDCYYCQYYVRLKFSTKNSRTS